MSVEVIYYIAVIHTDDLRLLISERTKQAVRLSVVAKFVHEGNVDFLDVAIMKGAEKAGSRDLKADSCNET